MASELIKLPKNEWVEIQVNNSVITQITHLSGNNTVVYIESPTKPAKLNDDSPISDFTRLYEKRFFTGLQPNDSIWAYSKYNDSVITVTKGV